MGVEALVVPAVSGLLAGTVAGLGSAWVMLRHTHAQPAEAVQETPEPDVGTEEVTPPAEADSLSEAELFELGERLLADELASRRLSHRVAVIRHADELAGGDPVLRAKLTRFTGVQGWGTSHHREG